MVAASKTNIRNLTILLGSTLTVLVGAILAPALSHLFCGEGGCIARDLLMASSAT